jgi:hypothetical protein
VSPRVIAKTPAPAERRQELAEAAERIDEAQRLGRVAGDLRRDVAQMEAQRDALAALGDRHVEIAQKSIDARYRVEIQWEPLRSILSGSELAAEVEATIGPLRQELARTEGRIAELLA